MAINHSHDEVLSSSLTVGCNTLLTHTGRKSSEYHGFVNPPVYHGSTVLSPTVQDLLNRTQPYIYGRRGTPTSEALEQALNQLEGGAGVVLCPSGLTACNLALLTCLKPGDHLLMTRGSYAPVRHACDTLLRRLEIKTYYYQPTIGCGIAALITRRTRAIYIESPNSNTFELQDVAAIARIAHQRGITVIMDNSWATPFFFKPHEHGVDLSIQAGTKYLAGHSDAMLGTVSATARLWPKLKQLHGDLGLCVGPDDIYLALRGLRTLGVRLREHQRNALAIARWLTGREEVQAVLYPALEDCPGHPIWQRDFKGASGLFSIVLRPFPAQAIAAFLNGLRLFGLGYSWGGFESLAIPFALDKPSAAARWAAGSSGIRLHIGLEDPEDLIADLNDGFTRLTTASIGSQRELPC
ncbi:cystathionine beta-lyase [Serratia fonticola]|uniref:cystathionine beta-lyase n=1 Tax=Serratia fonticola TaxID=47917 RepID=UPI0021774BF6|nr:cystathionine beta-lyase [Serratia fonticola]CAI1113902.1 Cystathionine beta-lyase metC [Serratia fonticola]